jgi:hypothetical protein
VQSQTDDRIRNCCHQGSHEEYRQVIPKRNILRADIMVAPLDCIAQMTQDNHWLPLQLCMLGVTQASAGLLWAFRGDL